MERARNQESGIILVIVVFALALMIFGYVAINNFSKTREAERLKQQADGTIEAATDVRETTETILN